MVTERAIDDRRSLTPAARTRRPSGIFQAFVAFFDDPILLCDPDREQAHRCDGDDSASWARRMWPADATALHAGA